MNFHRPSSLILLPAIILWPLQAISKPSVVVSIPPQKAFVQAIAGDEVDIHVLLKPGQNPANFTLSPKILGEIARSDLYFAIGVPMEEMILPKLQAIYPNIRIVDTTAGIRKRTLEDHSHGQNDSSQAHRHVDDPHIWLSPGLVKIQLRHYTRILKDLLPDSAPLFDVHAKRFLDEVEKLDDQLAIRLKGLEGKTVFVYHPAFGYFLDRYGLRQETVELQGKQPSPRQLRHLIHLAQDQGAKVIFVQPQFDRNSAKTLAKAIDGRVEVMDPLAENYLDNLRHMGETIAESYR